MKEHDGLALPIAAFRVVETWPGLETQVRKPHDGTHITDTIEEQRFQIAEKLGFRGDFRQWEHLLRIGD